VLFIKCATEKPLAERLLNKEREIFHVSNVVQVEVPLYGTVKELRIQIVQWPKPNVRTNVLNPFGSTNHIQTGAEVVDLQTSPLAVQSL